MRVIFLDIDGVLNCASTRNCWAIKRQGEVRGLIGIEPRLTEILNRLLDQTDAKLVLSSTWRLTDGIAGTVENLNAAGFRHSDRFVGVTPDCAQPLNDGWFRVFPGHERGHEIREWLSDWRGEPITSFVILDDSNDMAHLLPRLARCDHEVGLTEEVAGKALAMLDEPVSLADFEKPVAEPEAA